MSEVNSINLKDIKFTRDVKIDYQNGNPIINSVFRQFDKDISGDFNDEEYDAYMKYLEKIESRDKEIESLKVNKKTVSHYDKEVLKIKKKCDALKKEFSAVIEADAFNKLIEFEKSHSNINREGCKDKSEIPENAVKIDISAFGMGVYNEKEKRFTGETCKIGYITGLDTLSKEEKKEYFKLYDSAINSFKKIEKVNKKYKEYDELLDKYLALKDMADNGMLEKVGSKEYEDEKYNQYQQIRNTANPFLREIENIEQKYNELRLKEPKTQEDDKLLEQYKIQKQQLEMASKNWSIRDAVVEKRQKNSNGFKITNVSEQFTYTKAENQETYADTHNLSAQYKNENFNIEAGLLKTEEYTSHQKRKDRYNLNLSGSYSRADWTFSENSQLSISDNNKVYTQDASVRYKNTELKVNEEITKTKFESGESSTSNSTQINLSQSVGKFNNTASVNFADEGTTYSLGSSTSFNIKANDNLNFNLMPSANVAYNEKIKTTTFSPSFTGMAMYNNGNLNSMMIVNDNFSSTVQSGSKPQINNNFSVNGNVQYKRFSAGINYNNNYSAYSVSNTYGANASYSIPKAGTLAVEYNYQNTRMPDSTRFETSTLIAKYTLPLDTINGWFKGKKD